MRPNNRSYSEVIRRARKLNNLTQADLAQRLGVSQGYVAQWETGRQIPGNQWRKNLARVLGISKDTRAGDLDDVEGRSEFGAWLKHNREKKDFSVPELAKEAGVTSKTIYDIESGNITNPQEKTIERLEKALKADVPQEAIDEMNKDAKFEGIGEWRDFDIKSESARPACSGIYILYTRHKIPLYVGESDNIKKRISGHIEKVWFQMIEKSSYVEI